MLPLSVSSTHHGIRAWHASGLRSFLNIYRRCSGIAGAEAPRRGRPGESFVAVVALGDTHDITLACLCPQQGIHILELLRYCEFQISPGALGSPEIPSCDSPALPPAISRYRDIALFQRPSGAGRRAGTLASGFGGFGAPCVFASECCLCSGPQKLGCTSIPVHTSPLV